MFTDYLRTLALRALLVGAILAGTAFTWAAAGLGFTIAWPRGCRRPMYTAKMRVKKTREAVTQFMIEQPRCPRHIHDLIAGRFLDKGDARDPWGSDLVVTCPGLNDPDGADVVSPGADRELGTADDIKSWEM